jgi:hypothetical protein
MSANRPPPAPPAPPIPQKPMEGLGDAIRRVTDWAGIKPCAACDERRDKLNRIVPFPKRRSR